MSRIIISWRLENYVNREELKLSFVARMEQIHFSKWQTLRGGEATKTLNDYLMQLEQEKPEELTDEQAKVLKFTH